MAPRVPADLALLLLHREAARRGDPALAVRPATLRQWRRRGHLSAGPGYDLGEIVAYVSRRRLTDQDASLDPA